MVAAKVWEDVPSISRDWSAIGELPLKELNSLELRFLGLLNYDVNVKREEYEEFCAGLEHRPYLTAPQKQKRRSGWLFSISVAYVADASARGQ